jgi:hypothetical protein
MAAVFALRLLALALLVAIALSARSKHRKRSRLLASRTLRKRTGATGPRGAQRAPNTEAHTRTPHSA